MKINNNNVDNDNNSNDNDNNNSDGLINTTTVFLIFIYKQDISLS